jgi:hypothetical protein
MLRAPPVGRASKLNNLSAYPASGSKIGPISGQKMTADHEELHRQWEATCEEFEEARRGVAEAIGKMSQNTPIATMNEVRAAIAEMKRVREKLNELLRRF